MILVSNSILQNWLIKWGLFKSYKFYYIGNKFDIRFIWTCLQFICTFLRGSVRSNGLWPISLYFPIYKRIKLCVLHKLGIECIPLSFISKAINSYLLFINHFLVYKIERIILEHCLFCESDSHYLSLIFISRDSSGYFLMCRWSGVFFHVISLHHIFLLLCSVHVFLSFYVTLSLILIAS